MTEIGGPGGPSRAGGGFWDFFKPKAESGQHRLRIDPAKLSASARRFVQAMKTLAGKALEALGPQWPERNLDGPSIDQARRYDEGLSTLGFHAFRFVSAAPTGSEHLFRDVMGGERLFTSQYECPPAIDRVARAVTALERQGVITAERAMLFHHRVQDFEMILLAVVKDTRKFPTEPQAFVKQLLRNLDKAEKKAPPGVDLQRFQTIRKAAKDFQAVIDTLRQTPGGLGH